MKIGNRTHDIEGWMKVCNGVKFKKFKLNGSDEVAFYGCDLSKEGLLFYQCVQGSRHIVVWSTFGTLGKTLISTCQKSFICSLASLCKKNYWYQLKFKQDNPLIHQTQSTKQ